jgi:CelD/BcsL family acetyltransferase involved in cellulose biosynthesis
VNELRLSIHAISDPRKISEIEEELDAFIIKNSRNPFMFSVFIKKTMKSTLQKDSIPIVLVLMADGKIIGVVPLSLRKKFGIRFASFLFGYDYSPDFIFDREYSGVCMQNSLNFIFENLGCRFTTLNLPAESLNLQILERMRETNRIFIRKENDAYLNHNIIPVNRTWNDFQKWQGKNFRHRFKQIERRLSSAGQWQILLFENKDHEQEVIQKIMDIEKTSWKQNWRLQHHALVDESLMKFWWEGSSLAIRTYPNLKRSTWFLELNGYAIAYSLVFQYKGTAYVGKTSYNNQYRKIYPGIYINNAAIQNIFNCGRIKTIDFMTNLPFQEIWKSKNLLRSRLLLCKGSLPNLELTIQLPQIRRVMRRLIPELVKQLVLE